MKNNLAVFVGLPASGKSMMRELYLQDPRFENAFVYSTDDKFEEHAREIGSTYDKVFDQGLMKDFIRGLNTELDNAVKSGRPVIWDQTNMNRKKRRAILKNFGPQWVKTCVVFMPPQNEVERIELETRLAYRALEGKHIPKHVIDSMWNSFEEPTVDEGFDHVWKYDVYGNFMVNRIESMVSH